MAVIYQQVYILFMKIMNIQINDNLWNNEDCDIECEVQDILQTADGTEHEAASEWN